MTWLPKDQVIADALRRFDDRCADCERAFLTLMLSAEGTPQLEVIDAAIARQCAAQAQARADLEREMRANLREGLVNDRTQER